jgi:transketolase
MRIIGVPDTFAPTGTAEFLLDHFGISADGITKAALEVIAHKA